MKVLNSVDLAKFTSGNCETEVELYLRLADSDVSLPVVYDDDAETYPPAWIKV